MNHIKLPLAFILYRGQLETTVGEEKKFNPRLSKDLETFVNIMDNLNLPPPKLIGKLKIKKKKKIKMWCSHIASQNNYYIYNTMCFVYDAIIQNIFGTNTTYACEKKTSKTEKILLRKIYFAERLILFINHVQYTSHIFLIFQKMLQLWRY